MSYMYIPTSDLNLQSTTTFAVLHIASCAYYDSGWLKPWHTAHLKPTGCKRCGLPFTVMQLSYLLKLPFHVHVCTDRVDLLEHVGVTKWLDEQVVLILVALVLLTTMIVREWVSSFL